MRGKEWEGGGVDGKGESEEEGDRKTREGGVWGVGSVREEREEAMNM